VQGRRRKTTKRKNQVNSLAPPDQIDEQRRRGQPRQLRARVDEDREQLRVPEPQPAVAARRGVPAAALSFPLSSAGAGVDARRQQHERVIGQGVGEPDHGQEPRGAPQVLGSELRGALAGVEELGTPGLLFFLLFLLFSAASLDSRISLRVGRRRSSSSSGSSSRGSRSWSLRAGSAGGPPLSCSGPLSKKEEGSDGQKTLRARESIVKKTKN